MDGLGDQGGGIHRLAETLRTASRNPRPNFQPQDGWSRLSRPQAPLDRLRYPLEHPVKWAAYDASFAYRRYAHACSRMNPISRHMRHGSQRIDGRSAEAKRIKVLVGNFVAALGGPTAMTPALMANIIRAA